MIENDTIVAPATPVGESALAVVRVSGPLAGMIAGELNGDRQPSPWKLWHGPYRTAGGNEIDEVVCSYFRSPKSYTGEDVVEISSHGNPFIVSRIVDDLVSRGCRLAEPGEFTKRAFLSGRLDLTRAEAVMDVIRARSDRALEAAQRQLRGNLGRWIQALVDRLLRTCAAIEAFIDFPDEDLPPEDRSARLNEVAELIAEVERLQATQRSGDLLRDGIKVVLLGEPNAGKSSVLNRLAGFDRAIVSEEPGTTRDFLEETISLGPHRLCLVDTAGLREAEGRVERMGVERTFERAEKADLFVFVVDASRPAPTLPDVIRSRLNSEIAVVAVNKSDLPNQTFSGLQNLDTPMIKVSALKGDGFDVLRERLLSMADELVGHGLGDEGVAVNARHSAALAETLSGLQCARSLLEKDASLELIGSELRGAVDGLGRIVGRIDNEAVLDHLFSEFCIGK
jgi:tRNA modification GTPase